MIGLKLKRLYAKLRGHTLYMPLQQQDTNQPIQSVNKFSEAIEALGILGIIMAYFFLCVMQKKRIRFALQPQNRASDSQ